jgi:serine/threonine-protein kinase
MVGESIGQYRIEEKLGEGGVGEVYRATDLVLSREVALKRLRPELARRPDVVERFRSEACTLAQLNHPNIAALHHFDRDGDDWFMVMEYLDGITVSGLLQQAGPLPLDDALSIFVQALEGIGYAHARGVVHRDIKGSNLIVLPDGRVKIMDFGIARVLGAERLTLLGHPVGTPEYMAPEQIRGEEIDGRADIYALGALLYALLSGETPFRGGSDYELMRAQIENAPPSLAGRVAGLPDGIDAAALRALAKDPADRFASAAELREAIAPWADSARPGPLRAMVADEAPAVPGVIDAASVPGSGTSAETTRVLSEGVGERSVDLSDHAPWPLDARDTRTLLAPAATRPHGRVRGLRSLGVAAAIGVLLAGLNWLGWTGPTERPPPPEVAAQAAAGAAAVGTAPRPAAGAGATERPEAGPSGHPPPTADSRPAPTSPQGHRKGERKAEERVAQATRTQTPRETTEEKRTRQPAAAPARLPARARRPAPRSPAPTESEAPTAVEGAKGWVIRRH